MHLDMFDDFLPGDDTFELTREDNLLPPLPMFPLVMTKLPLTLPIGDRKSTLFLSTMLLLADLVPLLRLHRVLASVKLSRSNVLREPNLVDPWLEDWCDLVVVVLLQNKLRLSR